MKVCDKCRKEGTLYPLKIKNKSADLCSDCSDRIIDWLNKQEKKSILDILK